MVKQKSLENSFTTQLKSIQLPFPLVVELFKIRI